MRFLDGSGYWPEYTNRDGQITNFLCGVTKYNLQHGGRGVGDDERTSFISYDSDVDNWILDVEGPGVSDSSVRTKKEIYAFLENGSSAPSGNSAGSPQIATDENAQQERTAKSAQARMDRIVAALGSDKTETAPPAGGAVSAVPGSRTPAVSPGTSQTPPAGTSKRGLDTLDVPSPGDFGTLYPPKKAAPLFTPALVLNSKDKLEKQIMMEAAKAQGFTVKPDEFEEMRRLALLAENGSYAPSVEDAKRVAGQRGLSIVGCDPAKAAAYVHHQAAEVTCGVVVQQEVLAMRNKIPNDDQEGWEKKLRTEAVQNGYMTAGGDTHAESGAALLKLHGVASIAHENAAPDDLRLALKNCNPLLVPVNRLLGALPDVRSWVSKEDPSKIHHIVLLTAMAYDSTSNRLLGFFINDSGNGAGGRFVAKDQFLAAWNSGTFIEPQ